MPYPESSYPAAIDDYSALITGEVQPLLVNKSLHGRRALGGVTAIESTLGVNPQGAQADVAARLSLIETDQGLYVLKAGDSIQGNIIFNSGAKLGLNRVLAPVALIHVGSDTSGTVGAGAIILGNPHPTNNVGNHAVIEGEGNSASGTDSHAEGNGTTASGDQSHAEGVTTTSSGNQSHAEGITTTASGDGSHAEGNNNVAGPGNGAHAEGINTLASAQSSHAEGDGTTASGVSSHAEGDGTTASGSQSHAGGLQSVADGNISYAFGVKAQAGGFNGVQVLTDDQAFETTADEAKSWKGRFQGGWKLVRGGGADNVDGPEYEIKQAPVNTTDATPTAIQILTPPADSVMLLETRILARRTGGTAGATGDCWLEAAITRVKTVGGVITFVDPMSLCQSGDVVGFSATWVVNGGNIEFQVTGIVNNNITWHTTTKIQRLF